MHGCLEYIVICYQYKLIFSLTYEILDIRLLPHFILIAILCLTELVNLCMEKLTSSLVFKLHFKVHGRSELMLHEVT